MFSRRASTYLRVTPARLNATPSLGPLFRPQHANYTTKKPRYRPNEPHRARSPSRPLELDLMDIPEPNETTLEPPKPQEETVTYRGLEFKAVYKNLRLGITTLPVPKFQPRDLIAFCLVAQRRKDFSVIKNLADSILSGASPGGDLSKDWVIPLLFRENIVHCQPETIIQLFAYLPNKHRALQAATLFAHPGIVNDPAMLAKAAPLYGGPPEPEERVWPSLDMLAQLTAHGLKTEALSLLERLVTTGRIPPEALRGEELGVRDFYAIVHVAVARACLHWNLPMQAARHTSRVIVHLTRNKEPLGEVGTFAIDMLRSVVVHAGTEETIAAVGIVRALLLYQDSPRIPDGTLHALYEALYANKLPEYAARVYGWTRAYPVRGHSYPPPRGEPLAWLMEHLCDTAKDAYRARLLASHVTVLDAPLAPNVRANFITMVAGQGFANAARLLWERYSSGRFGAAVTANARLLVRMVSLFASLARREQVHIDRLEAEQSSPDADREQFMPSPAADEPTELSARPSESGVLDGTDATEDAPASGRSSGALASFEALSASYPLSDENAGTDSSTAYYPLQERRERYEDYMSFARRVRGQFVLAKGPLGSMNSWDINALARAHFLLGEDDEGFSALSKGRRRGRQPDAYDVAVALGAVARDDPVAGFRLLQTLAARKRLEPVALGTVIHHLLQAGLTTKAKEAMRLGRRHNVGLDLKSMDSVLRATLSFSQHDHEVHRDNLRRTLAIVRANQTAPVLAVASMGSTCVNAALDAKDSALAYDFWHEIMRPTVDRWDDKHVKLRKRLAGLIRQQANLIGRDTAHAMIATLFNKSGLSGPFDVSGVGEEYGVHPIGMEVAYGPVHGAKPFEEEVAVWDENDARREAAEWDGVLD
ncbi:unnamed protein product [Peniophora sp. CBMAI 1063]|nr:unnamed protein product [Peniophora sp. CBMAI 1063]